MLCSAPPKIFRQAPAQHSTFSLFPLLVYSHPLNAHDFTLRITFLSSSPRTPTESRSRSDSMVFPICRQYSREHKPPPRRKNEAGPCTSMSCFTFAIIHCWRGDSRPILHIYTRRKLFDHSHVYCLPWIIHFDMKVALWCLIRLNWWRNWDRSNLQWIYWSWWAPPRNPIMIIGNMNDFLYWLEYIFMAIMGGNNVQTNIHNHFDTTAK